MVAGTLLADRTTSAAKNSPYHQVNKFVNVDGEYLTKNISLEDLDSSRKIEIKYIIVVVCIIVSFLISNRVWQSKRQ